MRTRLDLLSMVVSGAAQLLEIRLNSAMQIYVAIVSATNACAIVVVHTSQRSMHVMLYNDVTEHICDFKTDGNHTHTFSTVVDSADGKLFPSLFPLLRARPCCVWSHGTHILGYKRACSFILMKIRYFPLYTWLNKNKH